MPLFFILYPFFTNISVNMESNNLSNILDHVIGSVSVLGPEIALILTFVLSICASLFTDRIWRQSSFAISVAGIACAIYALCQQSGQELPPAFFEMISIDQFSVYARLLIAVASLVLLLFIQQYFSYYSYRKRSADIYPVLIASMIGMNVLTMTNNWLLVFISIEILSIASYVMVGFLSQKRKESEAAMKYVLFGSVCAAVMLYGLSLLYGFSGSLTFNSTDHIKGLIDAPETIVSIALLFIFTGIGFKLSFVPFHIWSPDVYQGAPTPVTAFLATVPKIAVVVFLTRIYTAWSDTPFYFSDFFYYILIITAIATMLIGNLAALRQTDIKRMMAYSSIGHTGILLMMVLVYTSHQPQVLMYYLIVYTLMNLASFIFIDQLERINGNTEITSYAGLGKVYPVLFVSFTIVLISLIGLPPTAGFIGKLLIFSSVFEVYQQDNYALLMILLIVGALTAVISLFFYFKIPLQGFLRTAEQEVTKPLKWSTLLVIAVICTFLILILGIFPDMLLDRLL